MVYQDNMRIMNLENNGRASSGKKTRHINLRYFFVTDRISKGELLVEHCPTDMLIGDFYSKPLQGKLFRIFGNMTLNLDRPEINDFINKSNLIQYRTKIANSNLDTTKNTTK